MARRRNQGGGDDDSGETTEAISTEYGLELVREKHTTMDGERFSKCTTNTRNNGRVGVAEDGDGIASSVVYLVRLKGH